MFKPFDFRSKWNLPPKETNRCALCVVEVIRGKTCYSHRAREKNIASGRIKPHAA